MARYTTAYSAFIVRLGEVETLLRMARKLERASATENSAKISALCRGAVVLLSSHLEGYTKELGELTLTRIYDNNVCRSKISNLVSYYASRDLISEIKNTADTTKIATKMVDLITRDVSLWEDTGPHPLPISEERFNNSFSSPSFDKIASYINRFGYGEYKRDLSLKLREHYRVTKNLINHLVDTRNQIAHGDATVSKTPNDLLSTIPPLKLFCRTTDDLFASWCSSNICTVR